MAEETTPIFDLVIAAFDFLPDSPKRLVWIAGGDHDLLSERVQGRSDVIVKREDWQMDRLMVASDLTITKGNRQSCMELAALGVPSISLSYGLNRIDDFCVAHIASNLSLNPTETDSRALANHMKTKLAEAGSQRARETAYSFVPGAGRLAAAKRLASHIERLRHEKYHSASA